MNQLNELINNKEIFFRFIAERAPVFTGANVFLRDIQYGIKFFFEKKNIQLKYAQTEKMAFEFTKALVANSDLIQYKPNTWKVNFKFTEDFTSNSVPETE